MVASSMGSMPGVQQSAVESLMECSTGTDATGTKVPAGHCLKPTAVQVSPMPCAPCGSYPVVDFGAREMISTGTSIPVSR